MEFLFETQPHILWIMEKGSNVIWFKAEELHFCINILNLKPFKHYRYKYPVQ